MSNTIGFTNFRRFMNFPEIDLGDITILVGGNNAGKSTLVKAMLLMRDFLTSRIESFDNTKDSNKSFEPTFSFDTEHVNIGEFYRAFCRFSPRKENTISFTMKIDNFRFIVNIRGERKPGFIPHISMITVSDEIRDISFNFDFSTKQLTVQFDKERQAINDLFSAKADMYSEKEILRSEMKNLEMMLSKSKDLEKIAKIKSEIERTKRALYRSEKLINKKNDDSKGYTIKVYDYERNNLFRFGRENVGSLIIPELIREVSRYTESGITGDKRSNAYREEEANLTFLRGKSVEIRTLADELDKVLNSQVIEYIYAHSVYQDSVYSKCANSSDYTKRTIHEFYTSRISPGDDEFSLIEDWLKEFKIGESLKVIPYKGDNYSLVIFDKENPEIINEKQKGYPGGIDLADKGMGSIQIVILLLRLATLIRKYKGQQLTVLLEEPEQNLHPAVQSQLADLIRDINKNNRVRFIIETHSEYLVRHTQVLAAKLFKDGLYNIPFKVFYITGENAHPYDDMGFQKNGKFEKAFGPGFFNVADDAAMELFDLDEED